MSFRVATWNMDHWRRTSTQRQEAWSFLEDVVKPDVALVQEGVPPTKLPAVVYRAGGIGESRPWGSAVVSYGPHLDEIAEAKSVYSKRPAQLLRTHPGCVAVADVGDPLQPPVVVVSLYGLMENGYSVTTVHRLLSDLTPLFESARSNRLILAGDFNISTQFPEPHHRRHWLVLERIKAWGLVDCLERTRDAREPLLDCPCVEAPRCAHVRTLRHPSSAVPWQNDYLFASTRLANRLIACSALDTPRSWELSDHCPIVAEFAV